MARPKPDRLRSNADFDAVFRQGRSYADTCVVTVVLRRDDGATRVGFVASKKTGKAHVRNRIRRRLRAAWREVCPEVSGAADVVLIGRSATAECPFDDLRASLRKVLSDAGLLGAS